MQRSDAYFLSTAVVFLVVCTPEPKRRSHAHQRLPVLRAGSCPTSLTA